MGKEIHSRHSKHSDHYYYSMNYPVKYYAVTKKNRLTEKSKRRHFKKANCVVNVNIIKQLYKITIVIYLCTTLNAQKKYEEECIPWLTAVEITLGSEHILAFVCAYADMSRYTCTCDNSLYFSTVFACFSENLFF